MGKSERRLRGLVALGFGAIVWVTVYFETDGAYPWTAFIAGVLTSQFLAGENRLAEIHHRVWLLTRDRGEHYDD